MRDFIEAAAKYISAKDFRGRAIFIFRQAAAGAARYMRHAAAFMNAPKWLLAAIAMTLALSGQAHAQSVIDQQATGDNGSWGTINSGRDFTQSFTAGYANSIGGGFFIDAFGTPPAGPVTISLYTAPIGTAGNTLLASGTAQGMPGAYVDVMWSQVSLTVGQTYYLGIAGTTPLQVAYNQSGYAGGSIFSDMYNYGTTYDLTFRTYASTAIAPEPAAWTLMILGFGLAGVALRLRAYRARSTNGGVLEHLG